METAIPRVSLDPWREKNAGWRFLSMSCHDFSIVSLRLYLAGAA